MTKEQVSTNCLKKMFRAVKMTYPCLEFTKQDDWYTKRTWKTKQEAAFRKWMKPYIRKHLYLSAKQADREIVWFLLMWGWSTKD